MELFKCHDVSLYPIRKRNSMKCWLEARFIKIQSFRQACGPMRGAGDIGQNKNFLAVTETTMRQFLQATTLVSLQHIR